MIFEAITAKTYDELKDKLQMLSRAIDKNYLKVEDIHFKKWKGIWIAHTIRNGRLKEYG